MLLLLSPGQLGREEGGGGYSGQEQRVSLADLTAGSVAWQLNPQGPRGPCCLTHRVWISASLLSRCVTLGKPLEFLCVSVPQL